MDILDLTNDINFSRDVILPISKLPVTIFPATTQDSISLGMTNLESLVKMEFESFEQYKTMFDDFAEVIEKNLIKLTSFDKEKLNSICFLDYIYLIIQLRNVSEGENGIFVNNKCSHENCNEIIRFEINTDEMKVSNTEWSKSTSINLKDKEGIDIEYKFAFHSLKFKEFMNLTFLTMYKTPEEEKSKVFDSIVESLFNTLEKIEVKYKENTHKYKIIKSEIATSNDVNLEKFIKLLNNKLPKYAVNKIINNLIVNQPNIKGSFEVPCIAGHINNIEVGVFDFFILI